MDFALVEYLIDLVNYQFDTVVIHITNTVSKVELDGKTYSVPLVADGDDNISYLQAILRFTPEAIILTFGINVRVTWTKNSISYQPLKS